jgi:hypothetical protein
MGKRKHGIVHKLVHVFCGQRFWNDIAATKTPIPLQEWGLSQAVKVLCRLLLDVMGAIFGGFAAKTRRRNPGSDTIETSRARQAQTPAHHMLGMFALRLEPCS